MPKLNTEQLMERIQKRIHQLELGEEVAAKDIKALLSTEQQQQLVDALAAQSNPKLNKKQGVVMKKFLLLTSGVFFAFGANAQVSKFEGASATVALAYQSYSHHVASFVSDSGTIYGVPHSASKGLVGKIGLDYTWRLSEENFLAIGFDYAANGGGNGRYDLTVQGVSVYTDQHKTKQRAKFFIAPSTMINSNALGYFKLGYARYQTKYSRANQTLKLNAITYGVGAKFMSSDSSYFFAEANTLSGRSTTYTTADGMRGRTKLQGSEILVGYGVKF